MDNDLETRGEVIQKGGECKVDGGGMREEKKEKVEMEKKVGKEEKEKKAEKEEKECERKYWDVREEVLARYIVASWGRPRIKLVSTFSFPSFVQICTFLFLSFKFANFCFFFLQIVFIFHKLILSGRSCLSFNRFIL